MQKRVGRIKKYRKPYIVCENYTDIFQEMVVTGDFPKKVGIVFLSV